MNQFEHPQTRALLGRKSFWEAMLEKRNVMHAVVLRDLRTRFFNHGLGFLIVPLWPFVHLTCLLLIYAAIGRSAPYGDDLKVYFAAGLIPTLSFMYISRFMSVSLLANRPMLSFPVVSILDIIMARAFLEIIGSIGSAGLMFLFLWLLSDNPFPYLMSQAVIAYTLVIILSVGMGVISSVITMVFEPFAIIWALFMIVVYIFSGAIYSVNDLPPQIAYLLSFNPVLHGVEWIRHSYYPSYPTQYLDKGYLAWWAFSSLFVGLLFERVLRQKVRS